MAQGRAQVLNYTVDVRYFDDLVIQNRNQKRILSISTTPVSGDPVVVVFIEFFDATPPDNGSYVPGSQFVGARTLLRDFDNTYHVLQTERPVFIEFFSDANNKLTRFRLGAVEEPPGEGPAE
jgi:hypothetical protein